MQPGVHVLILKFPLKEWKVCISKQNCQKALGNQNLLGGSKLMIIWEVLALGGKTVWSSDYNFHFDIRDVQIQKVTEGPWAVDLIPAYLA